MGRRKSLAHAAMLRTWFITQIVSCNTDAFISSFTVSIHAQLGPWMYKQLVHRVHCVIALTCLLIVRNNNFTIYTQLSLLHCHVCLILMVHMFWSRISGIIVSCLLSWGLSLEIDNISPICIDFGVFLAYPSTACFQWGLLKNDPYSYIMNEENDTVF